jgi:hypothetical protein
MAISNYTELQTAIGNWLARTDLNTRIPEFIAIAESRINRISRLAQQETEAAINMVVGQAYNELPTGFIDVVDFWYDDDLFQLMKCPEKKLRYQKSPTNGEPYAYSISNRIDYDCPAADTYALTMKYLKRWNIAATTTNWLLTNHPDAYLYASLEAAELFIMNDERLPTWKALAKELLAEIESMGARARSAPLQMDVGMIGGRPYNIFEGC